MRWLSFISSNGSWATLFINFPPHMAIMKQAHQALDINLIVSSRGNLKNHLSFVLINEYVKTTYYRFLWVSISFIYTYNWLFLSVSFHLESIRQKPKKKKNRFFYLFCITKYNKNYLKFHILFSKFHYVCENHMVSYI